ncbi:MAG: type II toxin-antitoxin system RelE/ParE family toxin [Clostridia bacterium]|nr:type II toxin-antitoxin system RelE/ParE family toxin [Clostridia bacterium]
MSYKVETTARFDREFKKLDRYTQKMIKSWIEKNLVDCADPRAHGKGLTANRSGQWRYRIGDYRLICFIEDDKLVILAMSVGHRSDIYKTRSAKRSVC